MGVRGGEGQARSTPPRWGEDWEGPSPTEKKIIFSLEMAYFGELWEYFCTCPRQKNVELPPEVVICWPLKMYTLVYCVVFWSRFDLVLSHLA